MRASAGAFTLMRTRVTFMPSAVTSSDSRLP